MPFLHPWKCLVVRRRKRRCFARDMACPGKASIRAEYCANQTKNASPSSLRACAVRPIVLSLPLSLLTIEEEPRERPHQHPREHCVRSDHSLAQLGLHVFMGQRACETETRNPTKSFWPLSFSGIIASPKKATKNLEAFARYRECSLDAFHPLMQKREGRHEDHTSGRTQWGCSGACPKRRAVQRRPPRTAP